MRDPSSEPFPERPSRHRLPPELTALIRATAVRARPRRRTAPVPTTCIFGIGAHTEDSLRRLDDDWSDGDRPAR